MHKLANLGTGLKAFIARRGLLVLFITLVLANLAYGGWQLTYNPNTCSICHNIRPYVESYYDSEYADHVHYEANVGCKDCHEATPLECASEGVTYVTGNYENPMTEIRFPQEKCLQCHRSYESLVEQTSHLEPNPHDSHFGEMECYLCHKSHKDSENYCAECHAFEFDVP